MFDGLLRFQISENWRICGFHSTFRSKKCFSFRWASPSSPPDQGDPAGGSALDPRYRFALHALAMAPPLPNPKYTTGSKCCKIVAIFHVFWPNITYFAHPSWENGLNNKKRAICGNLGSRMGKILAQVHTCAVNRLHEKVAVEMLLNFWQNFVFWLKNRPRERENLFAKPT